MSNLNQYCLANTVELSFFYFLGLSQRILCSLLFHSE